MLCSVLCNCTSLICLSSIQYICMHRVFTACDFFDFIFFDWNWDHQLHLRGSSQAWAGGHTRLLSTAVIIIPTMAYSVYFKMKVCHRRWNIEKGTVFFVVQLISIHFLNFLWKEPLEVFSTEGQTWAGQKRQVNPLTKDKKKHNNNLIITVGHLVLSQVCHPIQLNRNQEQTAICKRPRWRHSVRHCQCSSVCIRVNLRGVSCCHDRCMRVAPPTLLLSQPTSSSFWLSFENCTKGSQL